MNRRNFLKLAGLTALALAVDPKVELIKVPPIIKFSSNGLDGFLIDIQYSQVDFCLEDATKDMGTLNPNYVEICGYSFKRGELYYLGCSANKISQRKFETSYRFHYKPGGHSEVLLHGDAKSLQLIPYADKSNIKGIS